MESLHGELLMSQGIFRIFCLLVILISAGCFTDKDQEYRNDSVTPREIGNVAIVTSTNEIEVVLSTVDVGVGRHRIGALLISSDGFVRSPLATVSSFFYPSTNSEPQLREVNVAVFRPWPSHSKGIYTTHLTFDKPGIWLIEWTVSDSHLNPTTASVMLDVPRKPIVPDNGVPSPKTPNKTLEDVQNITQLTTGSLHDPDLYQIKISDAISSGLPSVLVIDSPAFCVSLVCGPQVDVLKELKDAYKGKANFIHVDLYDNPQGIKGDLGKAQISEAAEAWSIIDSQWTFVIDSEGVISERFESFATYEELERSLTKVIELAEYN